MKKKLAVFIFLAIVVLVLDQASKFAVRSKLELHESIPVVQGCFDITYVRNPGAAFGIFASQGETFRRTFFISTTVIALVLMAVMAYRLEDERTWLLVSLAMIFGGAAGNLIDRVRWGEVVDFLLVYYRQYHWPAFNVADSAITVGMVILVLEEIFVGKKHRIDKPQDVAAD